MLRALVLIYKYGHFFRIKKIIKLFCFATFSHFIIFVGSDFYIFKIIFMKRISLLLFLMICASISYAQKDFSIQKSFTGYDNNTVEPETIVRQSPKSGVLESFEGTFLPEGWTKQNPDQGSGWDRIEDGTSPLPGWTGGSMTIADGAGSFAAYCTWTTGGESSNDQWLISPPVEIDGSSQLSFKLMFYSDYVDNLDVLLSTSDNQTASFTEEIDAITLGGNMDWTDYTYDLSAYAGETVYIAFREHVVDNYNDGGFMAIDMVQIGSLAGTDLALTQVTTPDYNLSGDVDISGTVSNNGQSEITSFDVTYNIDGGTESAVYSLTGISIAPGASYDFTHDVPYNLTTEAAYTVNSTISNINGGNDEVAENNTAAKTIYVVPFFPEKKVFGEQATGTWCGWCPRGHVFTDYMYENYPDTWIAVAVHNGDPMTNATYDSGIGGYIGGYPSGLVDRAGEYDPSAFEDGYNEQIGVIPPASIEVQITAWDSDTRELTVQLSSQFIVEYSDVRFNLVLSESNVSGTSDGYNQANYYAGGDYGEMGGYEALPNPVPAADMVYNHVAREILGGWNGTESSLPATISAGETHTWEYTYTLPSEWDESQMTAIGLLIDQNTGNVLNADEKLISTTSGSESFEAEKVSVYPNPADNYVLVSGLNNAEVKLYSIEGRLLKKMTNASGIKMINTADLENGTYFVKVLSEGYRSNFKIIVSK